MLAPYYSTAKNVRPGTDPVVLIKMVLLQHLFGIPSLRQTHRECEVNVAYRWFLGYGLLEKLPHFATVSYAFCRRFPEELATEIFEHILNKALNNRMVDSSMVFIDGTHIKASANKKKYQKEQVAKAARAVSSAAPAPKGRKCCSGISGRRPWIWRSSCAKPIWGKSCTPCAKKPLSVYLRTPRKNTPCVIHIIEA